MKVLPRGHVYVPDNGGLVYFKNFEFDLRDFRYRRGFVDKTLCLVKNPVVVNAYSFCSYGRLNMPKNKIRLAYGYITGYEEGYVDLYCLLDYFSYYFSIYKEQFLKVDGYEISPFGFVKSPNGKILYLSSVFEDVADLYHKKIYFKDGKACEVSGIVCDDFGNCSLSLKGIRGFLDCGGYSLYRGYICNGYYHHGYHIGCFLRGRILVRFIYGDGLTMYFGDNQVHFEDWSNLAFSVFNISGEIWVITNVGKIYRFNDNGYIGELLLTNFFPIPASRYTETHLYSTYCNTVILNQRFILHYIQVNGVEYLFVAKIGEKVENYPTYVSIYRFDRESNQLVYIDSISELSFSSGSIANIVFDNMGNFYFSIEDNLFMARFYHNEQKIKVLGHLKTSFNYINALAYTKNDYLFIQNENGVNYLLTDRSIAFIRIEVVDIDYVNHRVTISVSSRNFLNKVVYSKIKLYLLSDNFIFDDGKRSKEVEIHTKPVEVVLRFSKPSKLLIDAFVIDTLL